MTKTRISENKKQLVLDEKLYAMYVAVSLNKEGKSIKDIMTYDEYLKSDDYKNNAKWAKDLRIPYGEL